MPKPSEDEIRARPRRLCLRLRPPLVLASQVSSWACRRVIRLESPWEYMRFRALWNFYTIASRTRAGSRANPGGWAAGCSCLSRVPSFSTPSCSTETVSQHLLVNSLSSNRPVTFNHGQKRIPNIWHGRVHSPSSTALRQSQSSSGQLSCHLSSSLQLPPPCQPQSLRSRQSPIQHIRSFAI